ncbi:MAG: ATP-dependent helicase [Alcaligenaceae bacterium]|nr:ATP-dependent helicase [Alcaligenaceae bacterium]
MDNLFNHYPEKALLVEGVAGSGKSTLIAEEARHCVAGAPTLLMTFSRAGRDVLGGYMASRGLVSAEQPNLTITTIDGLAHQLLRRLGDERYVLSRDAVIRELLPQLVEEACEEGFDEAFTAPQINEEHMNALMDDLDFFRASRANEAESREDGEFICEGKLNFDYPFVRRVFYAYDSYRAHWPGPDEGTEAELLDPYIAPAQRNGVFGFRLISEAAFDLLERLEAETLDSRYMGGYRFVFIDEFHDTTPLQLAFLFKVLSPNARILAVGDRMQNIFAWRGTDTDAVFNSYVRHYSARIIHTLSSHRFGAALATMAGQLSKRDMTSAARHKTTISVANTEIAEVLRQIKPARLSHLAVVCRNGADKVRAAFDLLNSGHENIALTYPLLNSFAVSMMVYLYAVRFPHVQTTVKKLNEAVWQFLSLPHCLLDEQARHEIAHKAVPGSLRMYLDMHLRGGSAKGEAFTEDMKTALQWWLQQKDSKAALSLELETFVKMSGVFSHQTRPDRVLEQTAWCSWQGLLQFLLRHEATLEQWPALYAKIAASWKTRGGIRLYTVSEAKGREFDEVLVYNADTHGFCNRGNDAGIERNRFYVAITRTKKSLFLLKP